MKQVAMGNRQLKFPSKQLAGLRDANDVLNDPEGLRERFTTDGFLLIRGLHDRRKVLDARRAILEYLVSKQVVRGGSELMEGIVIASNTSVGMLSQSPVARDRSVLAILEGKPIFSLCERLLGEPAITFSYKWLRAIRHSEFTGAHYDAVYMGRGSKRLFTCWTPFGDIPVQQGTLAVLVGSHRLPEFEHLRNTYGRMDVDRDSIGGGGWFTKDPLEPIEKFGGQWRTTNFQAGDVIVLGMFTMHASTNNGTDRIRISCDTRFQPAGDSIDDRWAGESPKGHYKFGAEQPTVSIDEAKKNWGV
jgi:hypothetical protein